MEYFTLENTEGYTQDQLDRYNLQLEDYINDQGYEDEDEREMWLQDLAGDFFDKFMC